MGARIAPVAVEIVLGQRRARPRQLEQLVGRRDGDLGRQDLCLGGDDLGMRDGLGGRLDDGIANRMAGLLAIGSMAFRPALILSIDISA